MICFKYSYVTYSFSFAYAANISWQTLKLHILQLAFETFYEYKMFVIVFHLQSGKSLLTMWHNMKDNEFTKFLKIYVKCA